MKKFFIMAFVLTMGLGFTACGDTPAENAEEATEEAVEPAPMEEPVMEEPMEADTTMQDTSGM